MLIEFLHALLPSKTDPIGTWAVKVTTLFTVFSAGAVLTVNILEGTEKGKNWGISRQAPPLNIQSFIALQGSYWNYLGAIVGDFPEIHSIYAVVGVDLFGNLPPRGLETTPASYTLWNWAAPHSSEASFVLSYAAVDLVVKDLTWEPSTFCTVFPLKPEPLQILRKAYFGFDSKYAIVCPTNRTPGFLVAFSRNVPIDAEGFDSESLRRIQRASDVAPTL